MHRGSALAIGTLRKAGDAASSPPLSSSMGNRDMMKQTISPLMLPDSVFVINVTKFSTMFYISVITPRTARL